MNYRQKIVKEKVNFIKYNNIIENTKAIIGIILTIIFIGLFVR
jgi:hypothetical protein